MDSLSSGVDSPDSIASLTMHVPCTRRMSAGTTVSNCWRAVTKRQPNNVANRHDTNQQKQGLRGEARQTGH